LFENKERVNGVIKRKYALQFVGTREAEATLVSGYMMNRQREIVAHS